MRDSVRHVCKNARFESMVVVRRGLTEWAALPDSRHSISLEPAMLNGS